MYLRKGSVLGSVLWSAVPKAEPEKPKKAAPEKSEPKKAAATAWPPPVKKAEAKPSPALSPVKAAPKPSKEVSHGGDTAHA